MGNEEESRKLSRRNFLRIGLSIFGWELLRRKTQEDGLGWAPQDNDPYYESDSDLGHPKYRIIGSYVLNDSRESLIQYKAYSDNGKAGIIDLKNNEKLDHGVEVEHNISDIEERKDLLYIKENNSTYLKIFKPTSNFSIDRGYVGEIESESLEFNETLTEEQMVKKVNSVLEPDNQSQSSTNASI